MSGTYSSDRLRGARPCGLSSPIGCCFHYVRYRVYVQKVCVGGVFWFERAISLLRHTLFEGIACIAVRKYWMLGTDTPGAEVRGMFARRKCLCVNVLCRCGCVKTRNRASVMR